MPPTAHQHTKCLHSPCTRVTPLCMPANCLYHSFHRPLQLLSFPLVALNPCSKSLHTSEVTHVPNKFPTFWKPQMFITAVTEPPVTPAGRIFRLRMEQATPRIKVADSRQGWSPGQLLIVKRTALRTVLSALCAVPTPSTYVNSRTHNNGCNKSQQERVPSFVP